MDLKEANRKRRLDDGQREEKRLEDTYLKDKQLENKEPKDKHLDDNLKGNESSSRDSGDFELPDEGSYLLLPQYEQNLLQERKLVMLLDLDLTLVFSREGQFPEVKNVLVRTVPTMSSAKYTVRLRPGVRWFLRTMAHFFDIYMVTSGTEEYARDLRNVLQADQHYFKPSLFARSSCVVPKKHEMIRGHFGAEEALIVKVDDKQTPWDSPDNLLLVFPYIYMPLFSVEDQGNVPSDFLSTDPASEEDAMDMKSSSDPNPSNGGSGFSFERQMIQEWDKKFREKGKQFQSILIENIFGKTDFLDAMLVRASSPLSDTGETLAKRAKPFTDDGGCNPSVPDDVAKDVSTVDTGPMAQPPPSFGIDEPDGHVENSQERLEETSGAEPEGKQEGAGANEASPVEEEGHADIAFENSATDTLLDIFAPDFAEMDHVLGSLVDVPLGMVTVDVREDQDPEVSEGEEEPKRFCFDESIEESEIDKMTQWTHDEDPDDDMDDYLLETATQLLKIHTVYFKVYDRMNGKGSWTVPTVSTVMEKLKSKVLEGVRITFGTIYSGPEVKSNMAKALGAEVLGILSTRKTTHFVVDEGSLSDWNRAKAVHPKVKSVWMRWLERCSQALEKVDEEGFLYYDPSSPFHILGRPTSPPYLNFASTSTMR